MNVKEREALTVKALARASHVTTDTIRHYAQIGLLRPRRDPENGYRYFSERDVLKVRFVKQAKMLGYTLPEIIKIVELSSSGPRACPVAREIIQKRIRKNRAHLEEMSYMQSHLEHALEQWSELPNGVPNGEHICQLIESTE